MSQLSDNRQRRFTVRDTHTDRLPFGYQDLRQLLHLRGGEDECIRTGDQMLHDLECSIADVRKAADVCEIRTHEAEWFVGPLPLDEMDALDGVLVHDAASKPVHGIGRVDHEASGSENFRGLADGPGFGVSGVDGEDHGPAGNELIC